VVGTAGTEVMTVERFSRSGRRSTRPTREVREAGGVGAGATLETGEATAVAEERDAAGGQHAGAGRHGAGCRDSTAEEISAVAEDCGGAKESPTTAGEGVHGATGAVAGGVRAGVRDRTASGGST
jgi:hypothetical protein